MIQLKDAIAEMDLQDHRSAKKPFSIVYMDANRKKKTGGNVISVSQAVKCGLPYNCKDREMRGIIDLATNKKTAVHLRAILEFNGQEVFW